MMVATTQVTESLQTLIDSRLDTIDRMLLGRLPRSERLEVVREVEGQIHELLGERGSDDLTREDVLAVLARLDPPEAYLPEGESGVSIGGCTPNALFRPGRSTSVQADLPGGQGRRDRGDPVALPGAVYSPGLRVGHAHEQRDRR